MERLSRFQFVHWLRTGRVAVDPEQPPEVKFNPNHDPKNGQFTYSGEGGSASQPSSVLRTMGLPVESISNPQPTPAEPKAQSAATRRQQRRSTIIMKKLKPIPGYPETGADSWRAADDKVFIDAANKFNSERGLKPGDPKYIDPQLIKAWAMVESGGDKAAFLRDPLQANNPGDWNTDKLRLLGLQKDQPMTPELSAQAALKWLEHKGTRRDKATSPPRWLGWDHAFEQYNGRNELGKDGVPLKLWYRQQVMKLYSTSKSQR